MSITTTIAGWIDAILPEATLAVEADRFRGRMIIVSCILLVVFGTFFSFYLPTQPNMPTVSIWAVPIGTVLVALVPALMKVSRDVTPGAWLLLIVLFGSLTATTQSGAGIFDASLWWMPMLPLFAAFLIGARGAVISGTLVTAYFFFLFVNVDLNAQRIPEEDANFIFLCGGSMVVISTALSWIYERGRNAARLELMASLARLEKTTAELEAATAISRRGQIAAEAREAQKETFLGSLAEDTARQAENMESARTALEEMTANLQSIATMVTGLERGAASSELNAQAMRDAAESMAGDSAAMNDQVQAVASALDDVAHGAQSVAQSVGRVEEAANNTVGAIQEMGGNIDDIGRFVGDVAHEAERMALDADRGHAAVIKTKESISEVQLSAASMGDVIRALGARVQQIGRILEVIDEVVDQTKLLSLNASIIASQAGDAGKSFAVVAHEMKNLSERTGTSTHEIVQLIGDIRDRAAEAVHVIRSGEEAVDNAVEVVGQAETALMQILDSTSATSTAVRSISERTQDQSKAAARVENNMREVAATIEDTSATLTQQAALAREVKSAGDRVAQLSERVSEASNKQTLGGKRIEASVSEMHTMLRTLSQAHRDQLAGTRLVLASVDEVNDVQQQQLERTRTFRDVEPVHDDAMQDHDPDRDI